MPQSKARDRWDKIQILLDPIGKALTALIVVILGYFVNNELQRDQKRRAYVELITQRELADINLRKEIFTKVNEQFTRPGGTLEEQILSLEFLVYNFHASIDLAPLLKHLYERTTSDSVATPHQRRHLQTLAEEIVARDLVALTENGCSSQADVIFDELERKFVQPNVIRLECAGRGGLPARRFSADVMTNPAAIDFRRRTELSVVLRVSPLTAKDSLQERQTFDFTVNPFNFPSIDHVRLGYGGGRVSVVMTRIDEGAVRLALVYFADTLTSIKDKPFQDELLKELQP